MLLGDDVIEAFFSTTPVELKHPHGMLEERQP
jgi:hypothetical protein